MYPYLVLLLQKSAMVFNTAVRIADSINPEKISLIQPEILVTSLPTRDFSEQNCFLINNFCFDLLKHRHRE